MHTSDKVNAVVAVYKLIGLPHTWSELYKASVLLALNACRIFHFASHRSIHPDILLESDLLFDNWDRDLFTVASLL